MLPVRGLAVISMVKPECGIKMTRYLVAEISSDIHNVKYSRLKRFLPRTCSNNLLAVL